MLYHGSSKAIDLLDEEGHTIRVSLEDIDGNVQTYTQVIRLVEASQASQEDQDSDFGPIWVVTLIAIAVLIVAVPITLYVTKKHCNSCPCFKPCKM